MNNKVKILAIFLLASSLVLAACGGEPEIETEAPQEDVKTVYIGPELVDCVGEAPQKCMQIKENPQDEYQLFYDQIEGFDYEEGYEYELLIMEENIENPPADASSIKWTLVEVVNKTPMQPVETAPDTTEAELPQEGQVITMYVGPELVDCVGVAPQTCMQVKMSPDANYTLFYDQIKGFEHESGYEYELLVLVEQVENPPADASTISYTLVEEVSKTAAEVETKTLETTDLEGTTWSLLSYLTPDGNTHELLPDTRITAEFNDGQIAGTAGCNNYFGTYELDGNSLTIGPSGSTMMFCAPEEVMLQETAYLAILSSVTSYETVGNQLHLLNGAGDTVLLFADEEPISLTGTNWEVVSYNNGQEAVVSVIIGTKMTALFGEDGVLGGSAGCNNYSAGFETEENNIVIGPAASTEMFCAEPEGIMEQETLYLAAIQNAATYRIDNDQLELRDAGGALQASYKAVELSSLPGSAWSLLFHNNGNEAMVSTIIDTEITAVFGEDGALSGSAGCNNYTASYQIDGDVISISSSASTRKFCAEPEGIMEQESQYLAALENAATYSIGNGKLDIRDANGSGVVSYDAINADIAAETANVDSESSESSVDNGAAAGTNSAGAPVPDEVMAAAANASYPLEYTATGTVQLTDGEFHEPAAEGSASEINVQMSDHIAVGEMSDGQQMATVILVSQTGGTGTFYDLAVLTEQDGQLVPTAVNYLGDRIAVNSLTIEDGQIVADLVVQGQEDPFCCPSQHVVQTYELQGEELVQTASEVLGTVDLQAKELPNITGVVWKWQDFVTPVEKVLIENPEKYTFELQPNSQVSVLADCNSGSGDYVVDGNKLSINITSTTLALCESESHSDLFFRTLNEAALYFVEDGLLYIDLPVDSGTMSFSQN